MSETISSFSDPELSQNLLEEKETAIGIDLGTAFSSAAIWRNGKVEIVPISKNVYNIPSLILVRDDEDSEPKPESPDDSFGAGRNIFNAKRLIGTLDTDDFIQKGKKFWPFLVQAIGIGVKPLIGLWRKNIWTLTTIEELVAILLMELKDITQAHIGHPVRNVVLSMPCVFNQFQKARLERACSLAGLKPLRIMPEPSAVAMAFTQLLQLSQSSESSMQESVTEKVLLVFNFGEGFCDVATATLAGGFCQMKSMEGDALGAGDIAQHLAYHVAEKNYLIKGDDVHAHHRIMCSLRRSCLNSIPMLSIKESAMIKIEGGVVQHDEWEMEMKREEMEDVCHPLFLRCLELVKRALTQSNLQPSDVTDLILSGGCSNIPKLRKMICDHLHGLDPIKLEVRSGEVVAYGAAVEAAIMSGIVDPKGGLDVLTIQVIPQDYRIGLTGGGSTVLLAKNTPIPIRKEVTATTCHDHQTEALIMVFEGKEERAEKNHLLGFFLLPCIPKASKGVPVLRICMDVDASDSLRVMGRVFATVHDMEPLIQVEVRMPMVDEGHGWCMDAIHNKYGSALDVRLHIKPPSEAST